MGLSVIIISKNEETNIGACIDSVAFADEIIVLDSGSTDRTVEVAKAKGARVEITPDWPGFGPQKQRALDLATEDWVLSLDADERVSPDLREAIQRALSGAGAVAGYRINRLSWFLGKPMRHGGWYPDRIVRLGRRERSKFSVSVVHERLLVDGDVGDIDDVIIHYSYETVDDVLRKMRVYALATAGQRRESGTMGGLTVAIVRSLAGFFKAYLLKAGFLDGRRGFVAAIFRANETFWRYISVGWEPQTEVHSAFLNAETKTPPSPHP